MSPGIKRVEVRFLAVVYIVVDLAVVETFSHKGTHAQRCPRVSGADVLTVSASIQITAVLLVASKGGQASYLRDVTIDTSLGNLLCGCSQRNRPSQW